MGNEIDVAAVLRLLGHAGERPLTARRYRSLLATRHAFDSTRSWQWDAQAPTHDAIAGLIFAETGMRVVSSSGATETQVGQAVFLHPHRAAHLEAMAGGIGLCVWVPWAQVAEVETGQHSPADVIHSTPLVAGLQAFLGSLLTEQLPPTLYTDYLIERIVTEMAFGVLLESVPARVAGARETRPIDRARGLMLLRRSDPAFGIAELADEMHMSARHLQRLFANERSTPANELRGMRTELANEMLGDPAYDTLTISEIALHAGFATAGSLRRAFEAGGLPLPARVRTARAAASFTVGE